MTLYEVPNRDRTIASSQEFKQSLLASKLRLLQLHYESGCGHLGGNLSCIDALMVLHHVVMRGEDRFILSKGHAAGALYVTLWSKGLLTDEELATFAGEDTLLPGHPSGSGVPGLLFSTGSLGHGPSLAAGIALAARHQETGRNVYCLCSDGEWQEGSCWEALGFAVHHHLNNWIVLVDQNGWQGFGRTSEVMSGGELSAKIESYGACVHVVDGHEPTSIEQTLSSLSNDRPHVVILETVKGKDAHFADSLDSHYLPLTSEQYASARHQLISGGV